MRPLGPIPLSVTFTCSLVLPAQVPPKQTNVIIADASRTFVVSSEVTLSQRSDTQFPLLLLLQSGCPRAPSSAHSNIGPDLQEPPDWAQPP